MRKKKIALSVYCKRSCRSLAAEQELRKLDSSVKRNTALIKKLRLINEDTKEALLDDIRRANQTKVRPPWKASLRS